MGLSFFFFSFPFFLFMLKAWQAFGNSNNVVIFIVWVTEDKQAVPFHTSFDYPFLKPGDTHLPLQIF